MKGLRMYGNLRDTAARQSKICITATSGKTDATMAITSSSCVNRRGSWNLRLARTVMLNRPMIQPATNAFFRSQQY